MARRGRRPSALGPKKIAGEFKSYLNEVQREIDKACSEKTKKAAKLLTEKLKEKVSKNLPYGQHSKAGQPPASISENLMTGITSANSRHESKVGFARPAYHAHLMEFGTDPRYQKTYNGKPLATPKEVGRVDARPFFGVTIRENAEEVGKILAEPIF